MSIISFVCSCGTRLGTCRTFGEQDLELHGVCKRCQEKLAQELRDVNTRLREELDR